MPMPSTSPAPSYYKQKAANLWVANFLIALMEKKYGFGSVDHIAGIVRVLDADQLDAFCDVFVMSTDIDQLGMWLATMSNGSRLPPKFPKVRAPDGSLRDAHYRRPVTPTPPPCG